MQGVTHLMIIVRTFFLLFFVGLCFYVFVGFSLFFVGGFVGFCFFHCFLWVFCNLLPPVASVLMLAFFLAFINWA